MARHWRGERAAVDQRVDAPVIRVPLPKTLAKYGADEAYFLALVDVQGGACYVCKKVPSTGRLCIDHEHVRGWKSMPPERRRLYIRGLLCFVCNYYYVGRGITPEKAQRVVEYLTRPPARAVVA